MQSERADNPLPTTLEAARRIVSITGVVQGVGFRPFVYQLATSLGLKGYVCNRSGDVRIEIEGPADKLDAFVSSLTKKAPPQSRIESLSVVTEAGPAGYGSFEIRASVDQEGRYQLVSPDLATCADCRREVFDPADRRYRYPFTNCTNCGPRFTIIEGIPYDRPKTTMKVFPMCPECGREYANPLNRRFHAQPNACPVCGPHLELLESNGAKMPAQDPLGDTARLLRQGHIVAVKGIGGFQLACDATNPAAVQALRERKHRPSKPFAIMVPDLPSAGRHAKITGAEAELLGSPASPIVLLPWTEGSSICEETAPGQLYIGLMLPYSPLHHLLLAETQRPLIMTSGNLSEEPIAKDNDEALRRLAGIADYFLVHNRDIHSRYDDSVALFDGRRVQLVRRARGYSPYPIHLPYQSRQILACGGEQKNTFCLTRDDHAFLSQHIGDLENLETFQNFESTIDLYKSLFRIEPGAIAYDLHPEYLSTKFALEQTGTALPKIGVQHHHAHIVSCAIDNGLDPNEKVIGVAFDGTGYGTDGTLWGGEFLLANARGFERAAHLQLAPLPGGAYAIRNPYRTAIGYLYQTIGDSAFDDRWAQHFGISSSEMQVVRRQIEHRLNCPLTSSCGRLFDAVAALLGVRFRTSYEGEAAIDLEMLATPALASAAQLGGYRYEAGDAGVPVAIDFGPIITGVLNDIATGLDRGIVAARFHISIAGMIADVSAGIGRSSGIRKVALSGGVFQNRLLLNLARAGLEAAGLEVLVHSQVPCNDGGISLGQAVIAHHKLENSP